MESTRMERDAQIDNAKGILIVLVVYAHLISNLLGVKEDTLNYAIWTAANSFHMCAFLIISGYLSKRRIEEKQYGKIVSTNIIPYLFAQFGLFLLFAATGTLKTQFVSESSNHMWWFRPSGALWYLFAVGAYAIIMAVVVNGRTNVALKLFLCGILAALIMGYFYRITYFRVTKLVCFFPYYCFGYLLAKSEHLSLKSGKHRGLWTVVSLAGVAFMAWVFLSFRQKINFTGLVLMEDAGLYREHILMGNPYTYGPFCRLGLIAFAIVFSMAFINVVPAKKTVFTVLGKYSIYVYVLHWIIIKCFVIFENKKPYQIIGVIRNAINTGYHSIFIMLPIAIVLCFLLASSPVRKVFRPFLEPRITIEIKNTYHS